MRRRPHAGRANTDALAVVAGDSHSCALLVGSRVTLLGRDARAARIESYSMIEATLKARVARANVVRPVRAELTRLSRLDADARLTLTHAARSPFHTAAYAEAFEAAGAAVWIFRVIDDGGLRGHVALLEQVTGGWRQWTGLAEPCLRAGTDPSSFWTAFVREGCSRGFLSAAWREAAVVRLGPQDVLAARTATEAMAGTLAEGTMATLVVDLGGSPDERWASLHRKHRNIIRTAQDASLTAGPVPREGFLETYVPLSETTWARSGGTGPASRYFERLLAEDWARPHLARDASGAPVAGAIVTQWDGHATYLHGASTRDAAGASNLLQWAIIRDLQRLGSLTYDLGGVAMPGGPGDDAKASGIRRFKERFGGRLVAWPSIQVRLHAPLYAFARSALMGARKRRA